MDRMYRMIGDTPYYMRLVRDAHMKSKRDMGKVSRSWMEVLEDNKRLREENLALMQKINMLLSSSCTSSHIMPSPVSSSSISSKPLSDFPEMNRSIVLADVPGCASANSVEKDYHGFSCANQFLS